MYNSALIFFLVDRARRVVQYGSKFVYWVLEQNAASSELVKKLKDLESSISLARKCESLHPAFVGIQQTAWVPGNFRGTM